MKEERFILALFQSTVRQQGKAWQRGLRRLVTGICSQDTEVMDVGARSWSSFYSVWLPSPGMLLPTFRWVFPP